MWKSLYEMKSVISSFGAQKEKKNDLLCLEKEELEKIELRLVQFDHIYELDLRFL